MCLNEVDDVVVLLREALEPSHPQPIRGDGGPARRWKRCTPYLVRESITQLDVVGACGACPDVLRDVGGFGGPWFLLHTSKARLDNLSIDSKLALSGKGNVELVEGRPRSLVGGTVNHDAQGGIRPQPPGKLVVQSDASAHIVAILRHD